MGCSPSGHEESDMTERLHFHVSLSCIGGGNGNLLQYSCLENPRDGSLVGRRLWGRTESDTTEATQQGRVEGNLSCILIVVVATRCVYMCVCVYVCVFVKTHWIVLLKLVFYLMQLCKFPSAATRWLNSKEIYHSSGGWKSQIKVLAGLCSL